MKVRNKSYRRKPVSAAILLALSTILASCGSEQGGGIIGTGITGTIPTSRAFASNEVTLKAQSGEIQTASIDNNGRFKGDAFAGNNTYLMRVDLGNNDAFYSVAYANGKSVVQNIHGYSDAAIRNWFATQGLDIDAAFSGTQAINRLPTETEIAAINQKIRDQIALSLEAYGLASTNLQTVVFDANDSGVDKFLDQNPILISNVNGDVSITIIINDPATGTQSTVTQGLAINTDLTATDNVPPTAPTGLRVLPSASDEIVLAWNEASDNIGVTQYEIARNGEVLATTPYPVFLDSPLQAGVNYTYTVTAVDAQGNSSAPSTSGSSTTLSAPDTVAPPPPTGLQLIPSNNSMDVRWLQSKIGDVAGFTVLRAVGSGMLMTQSRVTSTQFTDAGLNSGIEYCYQVITNDASMNVSAGGAKVCAVTGGSLIAVAMQPQEPVADDPAPEPVVTNPVVTNPVVTNPVDNDPAPDVLAGNDHLETLDISSTSCTSELDVSSLKGEARIPQGCYLVNSAITLSDTNLTIDGAVILKFGSNTGIVINDDASLTLSGTRQAPIVLTGQENTPGYWKGLDYRYSNNTKNSLSHVLVEYAGTTSFRDAAVNTTSNSSRVARLKVNNVLIRQSAGYGFDFADGTLIDQFDYVTSTQSEQPGITTPLIAGMFGTGLSLTGNATDVLDLTSNIIRQAMTLNDHGVPYNISNFSIDAPVEVSAGVTMRFAASGQTSVSQDGSLRASGTADNPVIFTAAQPTPGYWKGIEFTFSNSLNNELVHLIVEYAGTATSTAGRAGNITTNSADSLPVRLKMDSVTLRNSATNGFYFKKGTALDQFDNVISTQNEESGYTDPKLIASFGTGVDLTGNTFDRLTTISGTIETPQTWPLLNVPVRLAELSLESSLNLPPGQELIAMSGTQIRVAQEGSLTAIGTAASPIIFRGEQASPGYWQGIKFFYSNNVQNVLDHVTISDAGSGRPAVSGNVTMTCAASIPGSLTLSNAFISNSNSWGVVADDAGCNLKVGDNVTYGNNVLGDVNR